MIKTERKKILWVVYDFNQAGGQRYVYEICKALNKNKYEVDVLKVAPLGHDKNWEKEFYYQPTLDVRCNIFLLQDILEEGKSKNERKKNVVDKVLNRVISKPVGAIQTNVADLNKFLSAYGSVNFAGINVYKTLCISRGIEPKNGIIHILTAKFQDSKDIYEGLNKSYPYRFVSSFTDDILKFELADFKAYQHVYYPLCFETIPFDLLKAAKVNKRFTLAVFTRLSNMKPLDPYFYALKLLLEKGIDAELRVYGAGDPDEAGFLRQLQYLYIADRVIFPGHVESIKDELKTTDIDLIWFQANNNLPAGYAAMEIAMSALPQIFWNFSDIGVKNQLGETFPSFTSLSAFVNYTEVLLHSLQLRTELGQLQRAYVLQHNASDTQIHILEELFD